MTKVTSSYSQLTIDADELATDDVEELAENDDDDFKDIDSKSTLQLLSC
jgi:hypothetical protein